MTAVRKATTETVVGRAPLITSHQIDPEFIEQAHAEMRCDGVPGVALGVYHEGHSATAGLGVTNVVHPQPVDGNTLFQIASITKTFTATAILRLAEQGRLSLDDPVRAYLPDFAVADPEVSTVVTIRDCLTHSPGWEGDFYEDPGWGDDALALMVARMTKLVQVTPHRRMWSYNNAAFYVLGRILEVLHGRPYEDLLGTELLEPLGMDEACFFAHDLLHRKYAIGHVEREGETSIAHPWAMPRCGNPIGGLIASAEEMMRYARFQVDGGLLLSDTMRTAAFEPSGPPGDDPSIGLGWWLDDSAGERVVSHSGGANGQPCLFAMIPSRRFALVVFTNGENGSRTADRLLKWAMHNYFSLDAPSKEAQRGGDFDGWLGAYETRLERWSLRREGQRLVFDRTTLQEWLDNMDPSPAEELGIEVRPIGPDTILIAPGERGEQVATVLRDADGEIRWLRVGHRAALRQ
ncbi:serine hydrolase [Pedococcus sp. P5_B7]